jgi:ectoine hydroxylase-related dioxygenase (phytanoyl-CoA dioxygenase family)
LSSLESVQAELDERGYAVLPQLVPGGALEAALRHIHLDVVERGLPAEAIGSWIWESHWFPHLRWDPPIVDLASHLPGALRDGEMCDPQILLQPPDASEEHDITSHLDQEPPWAEGRSYRRIVGIALSPAHEANGGLIVWPLDTGEPEALTVGAGDAVVMDPRLPHSSGLNREGAIRYAVYFRFLEPRAEEAG